MAYAKHVPAAERTMRLLEVLSTTSHGLTAAELMAQLHSTSRTAGRVERRLASQHLSVMLASSGFYTDRGVAGLPASAAMAPHM